jgi:hypothetical protein
MYENEEGTYFLALGQVFLGVVWFSTTSHCSTNDPFSSLTLHQVCDSQPSHYHILSPHLGALPRMWHLAGL